MLRSTCPHCYVEFRFPEDQAGRAVECPGCRREVVLPAADSDGDETSAPTRRRAGVSGFLRAWATILPVTALLVGAAALLIHALKRDGEPQPPPRIALILMAGGLTWLILGLFRRSVAVIRGRDEPRK
ncbi:MAG: hypothetical protein ACOC9S_04130 [Planctomycetota bacterium]